MQETGQGGEGEMRIAAERLYCVGSGIRICVGLKVK